jgi:hypothetical protein
MSPKEYLSIKRAKAYDKLFLNIDIYDSALISIPVIMLIGITIGLILETPISVSVGIASLLNILILAYITVIKPPY